MSDFSLILDKEKTTEQMFKVCDYYKVKNNQIKRAIVRIDELKEKKYISILQELLDSGKLDNPPKIEKVIFNPPAQYSSYNPNIKEIAGKP